MAMEQNLVQNPIFAVLMNRQAELPKADLGQDGQDPDIAGDTEPVAGVQPDPNPNAADGQGQDAKDGTGSQKSDGKTGQETDGKTDGNTGKAADGKAGQKTDGKTEEIGVTKFRKYKKADIDSPYYSDPGLVALTTEYSYEKVKKDYFDDAVFIGDSRIVGMQDYSGLDNASFFAKTGMNVYGILNDQFIHDASSGKKVSVSHMLKRNQYKKIYLMVGINELGTGNTATFQKAYGRVLQKFRKWQPDAVIYVQGILPVSKKKAANDGIFNNVNINDKNVAIAQLADGKHIFYLDVSAGLTDKQGFLKEEYTFDDVHMYAQYYQLWTDYLMEHAVVY